MTLTFSDSGLAMLEYVTSESSNMKDAVALFLRFQKILESKYGESRERTTTSVLGDPKYKTLVFSTPRTLVQLSITSDLNTFVHILYVSRKYIEEFIEKDKQKQLKENKAALGDL